MSHDLLQSSPKKIRLKHERHVLFLLHVLQFGYLSEHRTEQLAPVYMLLSQLAVLSSHITFISQNPGSPGQLSHDLLQSPPKNVLIKQLVHVLFLSHVLQFGYLFEHNSEQFTPVYEALSQIPVLFKQIPFISQSPGQLAHDLLQSPPKNV